MIVFEIEDIIPDVLKHNDVCVSKSDVLSVRWHYVWRMLCSDVTVPCHVTDVICDSMWLQFLHVFTV